MMKLQVLLARENDDEVWGTLNTVNCAPTPETEKVARRELEALQRQWLETQYPTGTFRIVNGC